MILIKPYNRDRNSQLDTRLHKINTLTYWSSAHIRYIFLSFLSMHNPKHPSCQFFTLFCCNSMSCIIHFYPSPVLLTWVCFLSPFSLLFPLSPSPSHPNSPSLIGRESSLPINCLFPFNYLSHPNNLFKSHSFLSCYLNTVQEQWSLRNNLSSQLFSLAKEQPKAVTTVKISFWISSPKQMSSLVHPGRALRSRALKSKSRVF